MWLSISVLKAALFFSATALASATGEGDHAAQPFLQGDQQPEMNVHEPVVDLHPFPGCNDGAAPDREDSESVISDDVDVVQVPAAAGGLDGGGIGITELRQWFASLTISAPRCGRCCRRRTGTPAVQSDMRMQQTPGQPLLPDETSTGAGSTSGISFSPPSRSTETGFMKRNVPAPEDADAHAAPPALPSSTYVPPSGSATGGSAEAHQASPGVDGSAASGAAGEDAVASWSNYLPPEGKDFFVTTLTEHRALYKFDLMALRQKLRADLDRVPATSNGQSHDKDTLTQEYEATLRRFFVEAAALMAEEPEKVALLKMNSETESKHHEVDYFDEDQQHGAGAAAGSGAIASTKRNQLRADQLLLHTSPNLEQNAPTFPAELSHAELYYLYITEPLTSESDGGGSTRPFDDLWTLHGNKYHKLREILGKCQRAQKQLVSDDLLSPRRGSENEVYQDQQLYLSENELQTEHRRDMKWLTFYKTGDAKLGVQIFPQLALVPVRMHLGANMAEFLLAAELTQRATRQREQGNLLFQVVGDATEAPSSKAKANTFYLCEVFESTSAVQAHTKSPWLQAWVAWRNRVGVGMDAEKHTVGVAIRDPRQVRKELYGQEPNEPEDVHVPAGGAVPGERDSDYHRTHLMDEEKLLPLFSNHGQSDIVIEVTFPEPSVQMKDFLFAAAELLADQLPAPPRAQIPMRELLKMRDETPFRVSANDGSKTFSLRIASGPFLIHNDDVIKGGIVKVNRINTVRQMLNAAHEVVKRLLPHVPTSAPAPPAAATDTTKGIISLLRKDQNSRPFVTLKLEDSTRRASLMREASLVPSVSSSASPFNVIGLRYTLVGPIVVKHDREGVEQDRKELLGALEAMQFGTLEKENGGTIVWRVVKMEKRSKAEGVGGTVGRLEEERFYLVEVFASEEAKEAHLKSDHMTAFRNYKTGLFERIRLENEQNSTIAGDGAEKIKKVAIEWPHPSTTLSDDPVAIVQRLDQARMELWGIHLGEGEAEAENEVSGAPRGPIGPRIAQPLFTPKEDELALERAAASDILKEYGNLGPLRSDTELDLRFTFVGPIVVDHRRGPEFVQKDRAELLAALKHMQKGSLEDEGKNHGLNEGNGTLMWLVLKLDEVRSLPVAEAGRQAAAEDRERENQPEPKTRAERIYLIEAFANEEKKKAHGDAAKMPHFKAFSEYKREKIFKRAGDGTLDVVWPDREKHATLHARQKIAEKLSEQQKEVEKLMEQQKEVCEVPMEPAAVQFQVMKL